MSVLNQSGEEQVECPLCMEPLEVDDLNFFPCTCGYQICRFCWHRIRTDENGLCPACRKAYSENPADFTPLSKEQVAQLKAEKRQRDQQRKAKLSESRKHLANVRVVQKNLVFVVGLPVRLADAEILKRHEYFGKFGKIHKVVINQSTSYAGSQGPSASAYVTYMKSDDALRAIQNVNNITIDGRLVKSSLGTTKYCSHFMKNLPCPKPDCMYLHDFGDPKASFTKEQMHAGKHQEYERKLHDTLVSKTAMQNAQQQQNENKPGGKCKENSSSSSSSTTTITTTVTTTIVNNSNNGNTATAATVTNKENWPQLNNLEKNDKKTGTAETGKEKTQKGNKSKAKNGNDCNKKPDKSKIGHECHNTNNNKSHGGSSSLSLSQDSTSSTVSNCSSSSGCSNKNEDNTNKSTVRSRENGFGGGDETTIADKIERIECNNSSIPKIPILDDNSSFFSQNTFQKIAAPELGNGDDDDDDDDATRMLLSDSTENQTQILNDSLPNINSSEDWEAAFGFSNKHDDQQRGNVKDTLETFGTLDMFGGNLDGYHHGGGYGSTNNKLQESILEALSSSSSSSSSMINKHHHHPVHFGGQNVLPFGTTAATTTKTDGNRLNGLNGHFGLNGLSNLNGLDQQMSKFFTDFYKNGYGPSQQQQQQQQQNGLSQPNGYNTTAVHNLAAERNLFLLQQRQLEEQLMNLNMKQQQQQQQSYVGQLLQHGPGLHHHHSNNQHHHGNNVNNSQFINGGDILTSTTTQTGIAGVSQSTSFGFYQNSLAGGGVVGGGMGKTNSCAEDELGFDPFHETQKALAELIENEQVHKLHGAGGRTGSNHHQINGLVHGQSGGGHLPPPPPGFMQSNTHMNSFGSKILPYLNMNTTGQQQMNNANGATTPNNGWSGSFNQVQHHHNNKGLGTCNDWKVLDPAIVQSSKHYMLANMQPREHYSNLQPLSGGGGAVTTTPSQQQQLQNGGPPPVRSFDYPPNYTTTTTNYNPQIQANYNGYAHMNGQQQNNLNWLGNELSTQIASPPGFRATNQATKQQQEC